MVCQIMQIALFHNTFSTLFYVLHKNKPSLLQKHFIQKWESFTLKCILVRTQGQNTINRLWEQKKHWVGIKIIYAIHIIVLGSQQNANVMTHIHLYLMVINSNTEQSWPACTYILPFLFIYDFLTFSFPSVATTNTI